MDTTRTHVFIKKSDPLSGNLSIVGNYALPEGAGYACTRRGRCQKSHPEENPCICSPQEVFERYAVFID
jgi:hypothetical protein